MALPFPGWDSNAFDVLTSSKIDQLGDNDDYLYSLWNPGVALTAFTPSWTNLTPGSGTNQGYYQAIGKWVIGHFKFVYGAGSAVGSSPSFATPVSSSSHYVTTSQSYSIGTTRMVATGGFDGFLYLTAANTITPTYAASGLTSTVPGTWTTGNYIAGVFGFEAA